MCIVKIHYWYGRFGNNICQLSNAIFLGFVLHPVHTIEFPPHSMLTSCAIVNTNHNLCKCGNIINSMKPFEAPCFVPRMNKFNIVDVHKYLGLNSSMIDDKFDFSDVCYDMYKKLGITHIRPILDKRFNIQSVSTHDICIHIRSGDIMFNKNDKYRMPDIVYYQEIIDKYKDKTIKFICEDYNHNVTRQLYYLYNQYPNIEFNTNESTIFEDFSDLMNCDIISMSCGTFSIAAFLLSSQCNKVILPSYHFDRTFFKNYITI